MQQTDPKWTDQQSEQLLGNLLRAGVILAAVVVLLGGIIFLARHGTERADYREFHLGAEDFRSVGGILQAVFEGRARGIIQLGLLMLIGTPVARVLLAAFAFQRQRDYLYVGVSLLVLALLAYSLFIEPF
jgi:uncharacterized membrane protein